MHLQSSRPSGMDLLHNLVLAIVDARNLPAALNVMLKEICLYADWEYGEGWIIAPTMGDAGLHLRYFDNWYADPEMEVFAEQRENTIFQTPDEVFGKVWAGRTHVQLESLNEMGGVLNWAEAKARGLTSVFAMPLIIDDAELMSIFFRSKTQSRDEEVMRTLLQNGPLLGDLIKRKPNVNHEGDERAELERRRAEEARQAQAIAEEANKAKSEFLSRMSHELRTPLNSIIGFADLLNMEGLDPRQRENLGYIRHAGQHLLQLVNEVLDITGIETGAISFSLEPVQLTELVNEVVDLMRPQAAALSTKLEVELGQTDVYLKTDRQRMKQVLLNLLSNAIKYNVEHGSVILSTYLSDADKVRIEVADTGLGIDPYMIDKLYMPFERLGAERLGANGTGLGLALTKRLVEAMNGVIGVESSPGNGSVFWIEIPTTNVQTILPVDLAGEPSIRPQITERTTSILYVEDNLSNIRLVERILEHRQGIKLISCMQGRMALDIARDHRPNTILLDIHLPDMTGQDVLEALKTDTVTRPIPVIIISADATAGTLDRLMEAGAHGYLTKPIEVRRFLRLLDDTLDEAQHLN
jgi:signal transduction histidine kinase/ActR/RegA family two-component response regulator